MRLWVSGGDGGFARGTGCRWCWIGFWRRSGRLQFSIVEEGLPLTGKKPAETAAKAKKARKETAHGADERKGKKRRGKRRRWRQRAGNIWSDSL